MVLKGFRLATVLRKAEGLARNQYRKVIHESRNKSYILNSFIPFWYLRPQKEMLELEMYPAKFRTGSAHFMSW